MSIDRRSFLALSGTTAGSSALSGSLSALLPTAPVVAGRHPIDYGDLVPDPTGLLDLPAGFRYRVFSREAVDALSDGTPVPSSHDGMAAFNARRGRTFLVRNHEVDLDGVAEDGLTPVPHLPGVTYDHDALAGGTTTLLVGANRRLELSRVSLAGTLDNCAGGPTPWGTWLTCEEEFDELGRRHGYVFEVDPVDGGNPDPITAMGALRTRSRRLRPPGSRLPDRGCRWRGPQARAGVPVHTERPPARPRTPKTSPPACTAGRSGATTTGAG